MKLSEVKTTIKITGFSRAYPDTMRMRDLDGSIKTLIFNAEPEITADLEIEVETVDGRKTTHQSDLPIDCKTERYLVDLLHWAVGRHNTLPYMAELVPYPCPHCGSRVVNIRHISLKSGDTMGYEVFVECDACSARGPWHWYNKEAFSHEQREERAIEHWNRRL